MTLTRNRFFHHYRLSAHPFNPILVDIDGVESAICTYLESVASGELSNPNKISERWSSDKSIGHISLLLATLASGAHFSDLENPQRSEQSIGPTPALALSFTDVMHFLCQLGLDIAKVQEPEHWDLTRATELLSALDNVYSRAQPHLLSREHCHCLQEHQEHLALRMHMSFCVSVLCRPTIRSSPSRLDDPHYSRLRLRAKDSLVSASNAFLDFQTLSIVPLRTWSMVHTVLSSTLLLCIWQETRNDNECRDLQQRVFSTADPARKDTISGSDDGQWLSARHIRALVALRNAVRNAPLNAAGQDGNGSQGEGQTTYPPLNPTVNELVAQDPMFMPGFDLGGGLTTGDGN
ncbi:unnamed protein product [Aspergillus oryzae]|uniref:Unnamed protein product n=1 Tax=Aspergillus oryzae TaxID=5062 RepID=A0AAN5BTC2_ASPOZ|nr:unnamed protein product [Aspergillus oryzae]